MCSRWRCAVVSLFQRSPRAIKAGIFPASADALVPRLSEGEGSEWDRKQDSEPVLFLLKAEPDGEWTTPTALFNSQHYKRSPIRKDRRWGQLLSWRASGGLGHSPSFHRPAVCRRLCGRLQGRGPEEEKLFQRSEPVSPCFLSSRNL